MGRERGRKIRHTQDCESRMKTGQKKKWPTKEGHLSFKIKDK